MVMSAYHSYRDDAAPYFSGASHGQTVAWPLAGSGPRPDPQSVGRYRYPKLAPALRAC